MESHYQGFNFSPASFQLYIIGKVISESQSPHP